MRAHNVLDVRVSERRTAVAVIRKGKKQWTVRNCRPLLVTAAESTVAGNEAMNWTKETPSKLKERFSGILWEDTFVH
jgi:hypothetical protein